MFGRPLPAAFENLDGQKCKTRSLSERGIDFVQLDNLRRLSPRGTMGWTSRTKRNDSYAAFWQSFKNAHTPGNFHSSTSRLIAAAR
jgi:hypothetical protein